MGCRFGLNGKMVLRESEEAASDLEDLKELIGEIEMTCQSKDGLVEVSLSGEYSMSYGTAVEIEKTLRDFSIHVTEATYFDTDCDGEEGIIWIGTPENIKQAQRGKLIYETVVLLQQLTPDEINMALKMASDTKPAAPPVLIQAIADEAGCFVLGDLVKRAGIEGPTIQPHGRLSWNLCWGGKPFIDIGVMPMIKQPGYEG